MIPLDSIQNLKLETAGKTALPVRIHLVDGRRQPLCGRDLPPVPASFKGRAGERLDMVEGKRRALIVGCGNATAAGAGIYWESVGAQALAAMQASGLAQAQVAGTLPDETAALSFCTGALLSGYSNNLYRKAPTTVAGAATLCVAVTKATLKRAEDLASSMNWARALVDAPPNHMTPEQFARETRVLSALGVSMKILNLAALEKMGAHGLLSVGRSSADKPCMVVAQWNGRTGKGTDLAIVGKGLTFDGGGLNLKTAIIEKMKLDKGGAAAAIAALRVLALRKAKVNVAVVLALAENVIGPDAYRPGDVISSLAGLSIEVANTDA
jgi:leucyl aminopeptidase